MQLSPIMSNFIRAGRLILVLAALMLLLQQQAVWPALAQTPITARVDRTTIAADEQVVLTVTVSGNFLTIPQPDLAELTDFVVVSSSTSTQVSIVNGKMTSQGVFIYQLQPLDEGTLSISAISINIDGEIYQTEPIEIEVLPSGAQVSPPPGSNVTPEADAPRTLQGQEFFIEAEVSNDTPYLGEQVVYTVRFYQAVQLFGQPDYQPPPFTDFWSTEIVKQPHYNTTAAGQDYLVTEILTALFPANLGELAIEPARLVIPGGIFQPDIKLETNPVTLNVNPLPENAPVDFKGAVGQFEIDTRLNETETTVNEPLTLYVEIKGVGNIETLTEPDLPELPNWRFFDSSASTRVDTDNGAVTGIRTFERLIVPGQAGEQTFPPVRFSYYDTEANAYKTVSSEPISIFVQPDDSARSLPMMPGVNAGEAGSQARLTLDINHIKSVPTFLSTPWLLSTVGQVFFWLAWITPLFVMGGALLWKRRQLRFENDPAYARSVRAQQKALALLTEAREDPANVSTAVGRALLGYLSDKLDAPLTGLTAKELTRRLQAAGLPEPLVAEVKNVLNQVDIGRFAPVPDADEQALVAQARLLIGRLEKAFENRGQDLGVRG